MTVDPPHKTAAKIENKQLIVPKSFKPISGEAKPNVNKYVPNKRHRDISKKF